MKLKQWAKPASDARRRKPIVHIKINGGQFLVEGFNVWYRYWRDPYHLLLTMPWIGFLTLFWATYVVINALFALAYLAQPGCLANAEPGSFADAFFFSVETLATVGYGVIYPKTLYANTVMTIETLFGLVGLAVLTGLAFARFSRPTARIIFSRFAVVQPYDGVPALMFRAVNKRRNQVLEAQMQVSLMRDEVTLEGQQMRRFYDLQLLRNRTPSFMLSWTAIHPIDERSPLYGETIESLMQARATIVVSFSGMDETVSQIIHARHSYAAEEIRWNHRLVDVFHDTPDGHRYIDYNFFHDIVPLK